MLRLRGVPFCTGMSHYRDDPQGRNREANIWIDIGVEVADSWWVALVDTAAPWCVVEPAIARTLDLSTGEETAISTRLGIVYGELNRVPLTVIADEGVRATVDATVFASAHWTGPNVVGYRGFLERIRFAVDPSTHRFYYGKL